MREVTPTLIAIFGIARSGKSSVLRGAMDLLSDHSGVKTTIVPGTAMGSALHVLELARARVGFLPQGEPQTDLGRWSWLDSTDVDSAITRLKLWQDSIPADNGASVKAGYYIAKQEPASLQALAEAEVPVSGTPEVFEVLKRYAIAEQAEGWQAPDSSTVSWLTELAAEPWTIGSAQASAWLQGLGEAPTAEVIILPMEERSSRIQRQRQPVSDKPFLLEAYPNPSNGPVYVVCNVPQSVGKASLRITDLNGRLIHEQLIQPGAGIVELEPGMAAAGIYLAELQLDGIRAGQVKLALQ